MQFFTIYYYLLAFIKEFYHLIDFRKNLFFFGGLSCPPLRGGQYPLTKCVIDHTVLLIVLTLKLDIMDDMPNKDFRLNSWLN